MNPTTFGATWMRAWWSVWLWKSNVPDAARDSISSQDRRAVSGLPPPARAARESVRPGTRKTMPVMPWRWSRGAPTVARLARPSSKVRTTARSGAGADPASTSMYSGAVSVR
jgi:hypothetical protein